MARFASHSPKDDLLLWTQFVAGSVEAWGTLLDAYYRTLFNYGIRFGADRELLHDCIHDLFLDLWDRRQRLNANPENVSFYLLRAFRNKLIKEQQRGRTQQELTELDVTTVEMPIDEWLMDQETTHINATRMKTLLATLPPRQQEVLYLKFYVNLSNSQIAELMNLRQQSLANLLHTALQRLRAQWGINSGLSTLLILLRYLLA